MTQFFSWRRAGCFFALLLMVVLGRAADSPPAPGAKSLGELQRQLEAYVGLPRFAGALWGVKISSLESGKVLFEHHADRRMSPASNGKLYTAALALVRLGGDYRIVTPVVATATADVAGDL